MRHATVVQSTASTGTSTKFPNSQRPSTEGRQNFDFGGELSFEEPPQLYFASVDVSGGIINTYRHKSADMSGFNYCHIKVAGVVSGDTRVARVVGIEVPDRLAFTSGSWSAPEFSTIPGALLNLSGHQYEFLKGVYRLYPQHYAAIAQSEKMSAANILADLEALAEGWSGPNSVPPSSGVLRDTAELLDAINFDEGHSVPDIAVDEDGSVTLTFELLDGRFLAFDLNGKERMLTTIVDPTDQTSSRSKLLRPIARVQILAFLDEMQVEGFA